MADLNNNIGKYFKIITFMLLVFLILTTSWVVGWHPTPEILSLVLFLCAYTLLLVLPITKFKLGPSGFEGELERLMKEREVSPAPDEIVEEVDREIAVYSENLVDQDVVLMRLSIDIETTLRDIAERVELRRTRVGMGALVDMLKQRGILKDPWLLDSLHFFREHRNELLHEGKTSDVKDAINVGRKVLAKLRQIQKELA